MLIKIIRFNLKAYDYKLLDLSIIEIIKIIQDTRSIYSGPIPLPTKRERFTLLTSPNIDKDARDQLEIRTHHRIIDIIDPQLLTIETLLTLNIASGINIDVSILKKNINKNDKFDRNKVGNE